MPHPRTVAVTGVTGLVGHGITRFLLARGDRVIATVRRSITSLHPNLRIIPFDLRSPDPDAITALLTGCDAIVHTAAIIPKGKTAWTHAEADEFFAVNALGTRALLAAARGARVPRFVFLSGARLAMVSEGELSESMPYATSDPYSTSKLCAELMCREFHNAGSIRVTTLRISAPYGYVLTGGAVIPRFIRRALRGHPLELWGSGRREQVFTFVDDIARACDLAITGGVDGTFTITSGQTTTTRELADAVLRAFPNAKSSVIMTDQSDPGEARRIHYPIDSAREYLGYLPAVDIDAGLAKIAQYIRAPVADRCFMEERVPAPV